MQDLNTYIDLHETVLDYKHGNKSAAAKIIKSYDNYIWTYVNLIHRGHFNIDNKALRKFISMFSPYKNTEQYKYKYRVKEYVTSSATRILKLYKPYSENEIRNELICCLLSMAKKYSDYEKPSFHTYVDRCFHFEAHRALAKLTKDPLSRFDYEFYSDETYIDDSTQFEIDSIIDGVDKTIAINTSPLGVIFDNHSVYEDETLNDNWINGVTCSDVFKSITPLERNILIEHNVNKKTDSEIGEQYNLCRATINRRRLKAIEKLKKAMNIE